MLYSGLGRPRSACPSLPAARVQRLELVHLKEGNGHSKGVHLNSYLKLCTEYYDIDKPSAPEAALDFYLHYAR